VKVVQGRAEARWLPSRHRFAMFKLFAFFRMRTAAPQPQEGLVLIVDRDQTAFEHHAMSLWMVLTVTCYLAATVFASWPLLLALVVAFLLAPTVIHVPMLSIGALTRGHRWLNTFLLMTVFVAAAAYFARFQTWVRFAAWQVLGFIALNAIAALIVYLLRGAIAELERGVVSEN
jgi:hypothetical protein